jgi:hypothetical protein
LRLFIFSPYSFRFLSIFTPACLGEELPQGQALILRPSI